MARAKPPRNCRHRPEMAPERCSASRPRADDSRAPARKRPQPSPPCSTARAGEGLAGNCEARACGRSKVALARRVCDTVEETTPNRDLRRRRCGKACALQEAPQSRHSLGATHGGSKRKGRRGAAVSFNQRFWARWRSRRRCSNSGLIGKVNGFRSIYFGKIRTYPAMTRYRYDLPQEDRATIIDLTIHRSTLRGI